MSGSVDRKPDHAYSDRAVPDRAALGHLAPPYVGLLPFDEDDNGIFFGRGGQIGEMIALLRTRHFLAVIGASGSGKSSLVRAGLLPAIRRGGLGGGQTWEFLKVCPGRSPYENLSNQLLGGLATQRRDYADRRNYWEWTLRSGPRGLLEVLDDLEFPADGRLVLLVDQFEELFRFAGLGQDRAGIAASRGERAAAADEAMKFVEMLLATASARDPRVYPVVTMRSEFLGECEAFSGLSTAISRAQFLTSRLDRDQLREVIERPVERLGMEIDRAVVAKLLNTISLAQDQLPRLEHLLLRMWTRTLDPDSGLPCRRKITRQDYEVVGGFERALDQHLSEIHESLGGASDRAERQRVARVVFVGLCQRSPEGPLVRRPRTFRQLADVAQVSPTLVREIVGEFGAKRRNFLRIIEEAGREAEDLLVDISHESLLRQWTRLRDEWLPEEQDAATRFRDMLEDAEQERKGEGNLWRPPKLDLAREWQRKFAPNAAWASRYMNESDPAAAAAKFALACEFLERSQQQWDAEEEGKLRDQREKTRLLEESAAAERKNAEIERKNAEVERKNAEQRQRLNWVLTVLLALAAAIAVVAYWFREESEENSLRAEKAAARAKLLLDEGRIAAAVEAFQAGYPKRGQELLANAAESRAASGLGWESKYGRAFLDARYRPRSTTPLRIQTPNRLTIDPEFEFVAGLDFSPDGRRLAAVGNRGSVVVWDVAAGAAEPIWRWPRPHASQTLGTTVSHEIGTFPLGVLFSADGRRLVAVGKKRLTVFHPEQGADASEPYSFPLGASRTQARHFGISRDGERAWVTVGPLLAGRDTDQVVEVNLRDGSQTPIEFEQDDERGNLGAILGMAVHPNDKWLILLCRANYASPVNLVIVDCRDRPGRQLGRLTTSLTDPVSAPVIHPAGTTVAVAGGNGDLFGFTLRPRQDDQIDVVEFKHPSGARTQDGKPFACFAGPHGEWVVRGDVGNSLAWSDVRALTNSTADLPVVGRQAGHGDEVTCLAVDRRTGSLATADDLGNIWLRPVMPQQPANFELPQSELPQSELPQTERTLALALHPDGSRIATSSKRGVTLWDAISGVQLDQVDWADLQLDESAGEGSSSAPFLAMAWHPREHRLMVGRFAQATYWDWESRRAIASFVVEDQSAGRGIGRFIFSPDGNWVAMGLGDVHPVLMGVESSLIRPDEWTLWDLKRQRLRPAPSDSPFHWNASTVAFLPRTQNVLHGVDDGRVRKFAGDGASYREFAPKDSQGRLGPFTEMLDLVSDDTEKSAYFSLADTRKQGQVWRIDLSSGRYQLLSDGPASRVDRLVFLPGQTSRRHATLAARLALLTQGELRICATDDGRDVLRLRPPEGRIIDLAADRRGERLVGLLDTGRVLLWEPQVFATGEAFQQVAASVDEALATEVLDGAVADRLRRQFGDDPGKLDRALLLMRNRVVNRERLIEWACESLQMEGLPPATLARTEQRLAIVRGSLPDDMLVRLLYDFVLVQQAADPALQSLATKVLEDLGRIDAGQRSSPECERLYPLVAATAMFRLDERDVRIMESLLESRGSRAMVMAAAPTTNPAIDKLCDAIETNLRRQYRIDFRSVAIRTEKNGEQVKARVEAVVAYCPTKELYEIMRTARDVHATLNGRSLGKPMRSSVREEGRRQVLTWEWEAEPLNSPLADATVGILDPITNMELLKDGQFDVPQADWPRAWNERPALHVLVVAASEFDENSAGHRDMSGWERGGQWTSSDAESMTQIFRMQTPDSYRPGFRMTLKGRAATRDALLKALQSIAMTAGPKDLAIVYLAGPGSMDNTTDGTSAPPFVFPVYDQRVAWSEIWDACRAIPCPRAIFLDASFAGLTVLHAERAPIDNCYLLLSGGPMDLARVRPAADGRNHGDFTWRVLEGLRGKADVSDPVGVTLGELAEFVLLMERSQKDRLSRPEIWPRDVSRWPRDRPVVTVPRNAYSRP